MSSKWELAAVVVKIAQASYCNGLKWKRVVSLAAVTRHEKGQLQSSNESIHYQIIDAVACVSSASAWSSKTETPAADSHPDFRS